MPIVEIILTLNSSSNLYVAINLAQKINKQNRKILYNGSYAELTQKSNSRKHETYLSS